MIVSTTTKILIFFYLQLFKAFFAPLAKTFEEILITDKQFLKPISFSKSGWKN